MESKVDFSGCSDDVIGAFVNKKDEFVFYAVSVTKGYRDGVNVVVTDRGDINSFFISDWDYIPRQCDGKGLPPVGTICEYFWPEGEEWRECEVVAHYKSEAVVCDSKDSGCARVSLENIRPLKTPEQKAAEEREAAVEAMAKVVTSNPNNNSLYSLYDARFRLVK